MTNCIHCGRDTSAKTGVCIRCRPSNHNSHLVTDEYRGRKCKNSQDMSAMGFAELAGRSKATGWVYSDDDDE